MCESKITLLYDNSVRHGDLTSVTQAFGKLHCLFMCYNYLEFKTTLGYNVRDSFLENKNKQTKK